MSKSETEKNTLRQIGREVDYKKEELQKRPDCY